MLSGISNCVFEWDEEDTKLLVKAKQQEMIIAGVPSPTEMAARKATKKEEMARHCRRRTRGAEQTEKLIDSLLLSLSTATDTLGIPLFSETMKDVWEEQKKHVKCIQDPPGIELYTITGHVRKAGVSLPVLRCARGSTSLESFHAHIIRFIPGTSASAVNFQAYLIEGIVRWNQDRAEAAIEKYNSSNENLRTFDLRLQEKLNRLSLSLYGKKILPYHKPPAAYTGELLGVEYLFHQRGESIQPKDNDELDRQIDEGFEDVSDDYLNQTAAPAPFSEDLATFALPTDEEETDEVCFLLFFEIKFKSYYVISAIF